MLLYSLWLYWPFVIRQRLVTLLENSVPWVGLLVLLALLLQSAALHKRLPSEETKPRKHFILDSSSSAQRAFDAILT